MKRKKIELIIELYVIGILVTGFIVLASNKAFWLNVKNATMLLVWIGLYFAHTKWLVPKYLRYNMVGSYFIMTLLTVSVSLIVLIPVQVLYLADMYYATNYVAIPKMDYLIHFDWANYENAVAILSMAFASTISYAIIRNMRYPDKKFYTKVIPSSFSAIVVFLVSGLLFQVVFVQAANDVVSDEMYESQSGQTDVMVPESMSQLSDVLTPADSSTKMTFLVFWTPSNDAQFETVNKVNEVRNQTARKDVKFVYVCGDYKGHKQKWRNYITTADIEGSHYYLSRKGFHNILINELNIKTGVEHIVMLDAKNQIADNNVSLYNLSQKLTN